MKAHPGLRIEQINKELGTLTKDLALPIRKLLIKRGDTWVPKTEIVGPGYRAGYGLVAIVHHQIMGVNERGEQQLKDLLIRTHGTPA